MISVLLSLILSPGRVHEAEQLIREVAEVNGLRMAPFKLLKHSDHLRDEELMKPDANYWDLLSIKEVR